MRLILVFFLGAFLSYQVFINDILPLASSDNPQNIDEKFEGNILERFFAKLLSNVMKTEQGQLAFQRMITPIKQQNQSNDNKKIGIKLSEFKGHVNFWELKTEGSPNNQFIALCGDMVKASYKISNFATSEVIEQFDMKDFHIGENEFLDTVIIGMKEGQTRLAVIPKNISRTSENIRIYVTLHKIFSPIIKQEDLEIFDDAISYKKPCVCGDVVSFNFEMRKADGKLSIPSTPMKIVLGDMKQPKLFAYALHLKGELGNRTVITNARLLDNFYDQNTMSSAQGLLPEDVVIIKFSEVKKSE